MEKKVMRVKLTFIDEILGTAADPELHEKYIASKAPSRGKKCKGVAMRNGAAVKLSNASAEHCQAKRRIGRAEPSEAAQRMATE